MFLPQRSNIVLLVLRHLHGNYQIQQSSIIYDHPYVGILACHLLALLQLVHNPLQNVLTDAVKQLSVKIVGF